MIMKISILIHLEISFLILVLIINDITAHNRPSTDKPNLILFLADDLGYGDLSTYGHPSQEDGPIDSMARQGLKLTQVYAAASLCTPSRAAILTGRQPFRTGMVGPSGVHMPEHSGGLSHEEITLAEALKQQGYTTGMMGKWHLGLNKDNSTDGHFLPQNHGFDYVGTLLPLSLATWCSNYMGVKSRFERFGCKDCFVYWNNTIVQQPINLPQLSPAILADAKAFIHDNAHHPFFLYLPFPQTHTPMFNMPRFKGKSKRGIFGDQINEMAWMVGEVMATINQLGLTNNTLSVFTSDHGPHRELCTWGGAAAPFSGGKIGYCEGSLRVPGIIHWPSVITPGTVSTEVFSLMDIFPSFVALAGGDIPHDRVIDGRNVISSVILKTPTPHKALFFYSNIDSDIVAVRYKQFKIYFIDQVCMSGEQFAANCRGDGVPKEDMFFNLKFNISRLDQAVVYQVDRDPGEHTPLDNNKHRRTLREVYQLMDREIKLLGDKRERVLNLEEIDNLAQTQVPCCHPPYCVCNLHVNLQSHGKCTKH